MVATFPMAGSCSGRLDGTPAYRVAASPEFRSRLRTDWRTALDEWESLPLQGAATPFQRAGWLKTWYTTFAATSGVTAVFVEVLDAAGEKAMAVPLVRLDGRRPVTIEFADLGICDYNFPLLGPAAPIGRDEAVAAFAALRRALPEADLLTLSKMPDRIGEAVNPLVLALDTVPSHLAGNVVTLGADYREWLRGLTRHHRKEIERFGRVFERFPQARLVRASTAEEAIDLHLRLEAMQSARFQGAGQSYRLDEDPYRQFYRGLLRGGVADRSVVVTALMVENRMIAGLYTIADETGCAMVRMAATRGPEAKCSPGRLLIERTIHQLHGEGFRTFDLTIGDYPHKHGFAPERRPLHETMRALSPRGLAAFGLWRVKSALKARPRLARAMRRLMSVVG